jgi:hypothetical protein
MMTDCMAKVDATATIVRGFSGLPSLFIHYGPAHYLWWTLVVARRLVGA